MHNLAAVTDLLRHAGTVDHLLYGRHGRQRGAGNGGAGEWAGRHKAPRRSRHCAAAAAAGAAAVVQALLLQTVAEH